MRLIITEKNNSAKKIADILSGGSATEDATFKVPYYTWSDGDGEHRAVGLKGEDHPPLLRIPRHLAVRETDTGG